VAGQIIVVDVEDDPEAPGEKRLTFRGVEGFVPPDSPAEMVAGDSAE
jgi:ATP-dependent Clp protease ATP-binding subunit ClpC